MKKILDTFKFMDKKTKVYIYVAMAMLIIILIIAIASCSMKDKKYDYADVENLMVSASKSYFKDHANEEPTVDNEIILSMDSLVNGDYIKSFEELLDDGKECTGEVKIKNIDNVLAYTPYLNCGSKYFTTEMYKKIKTEEVVLSGDGLYQMGDEYVYRGQTINNFIVFANQKWRIVKVDSSNKILIILYESDKKLSYNYDDRFNVDKKNNSGINKFSISRIKESIEKYYEDEALITKEDKIKLAPFYSCIGNRGLNESIIGGKVECNETYENYIGLLNIYDYITASIDNSCSKPSDMQCQNYNYLAETNKKWWTSTGNSDDSSKAYNIKTNGVIESVSCSTKNGLRPIVALSTETFYASGTGTLEDPYIIK